MQCKVRVWAFRGKWRFKSRGCCRIALRRSDAFENSVAGRYLLVWALNSSFQINGADGRAYGERVPKIGQWPGWEVCSMRARRSVQARNQAAARAGLKAKVALKALRNEATVAALAVNISFT